MIAMGMVMFMFGLFSFLMSHKHFWCFFDVLNLCILEFLYCWYCLLGVLNLFKYDFVFNYYFLWGKLGFKNFSSLVQLVWVCFYGNDELGTFSLLKC